MRKGLITLASLARTLNAKDTRTSSPRMLVKILPSVVDPDQPRLVWLYGYMPSLVR